MQLSFSYSWIDITICKISSFILVLIYFLFFLSCFFLLTLFNLFFIIASSLWLPAIGISALDFRLSDTIYHQLYICMHICMYMCPLKKKRLIKCHLNEGPSGAFKWPLELKKKFVFSFLFWHFVFSHFNHSFGDLLFILWIE